MLSSARPYSMCTDERRFQLTIENELGCMGYSASFPEDCRLNTAISLSHDGLEILITSCKKIGLYDRFQRKEFK